MQIQKRQPQAKTGLMRSLPADERPYEKCEKLGCQALSDAELLAVILRTGSVGCSAVELAREVLSRAGDGCRLTGISQLTHTELMQINGIGKVKALQIQCIAELSRRIAKTKAQEGLSFANPASIADYYMEDLRHEERENCILMMFNTRSRLLGEKRLSVGTVNASLISAREVFVEALRHQAVSIVLVHNHPSGDAAPSKADVLLTQRIKEAGTLIGIELIDHIIIGDRSYTSLRQENLM